MRARFDEAAAAAVPLASGFFGCDAIGATLVLVTALAALTLAGAAGGLVGAALAAVFGAWSSAVDDAFADGPFADEAFGATCAGAALTAVALVGLAVFFWVAGLASVVVFGAAAGDPLGVGLATSFAATFAAACGVSGAGLGAAALRGLAGAVFASLIAFDAGLAALAVAVLRGAGFGTASAVGAGGLSAVTVAEARLTGTPVGRDIALLTGGSSSIAAKAGSAMPRLMPWATPMENFIISACIAA
ncbi:MAG: hypothetical protein AAGB05_01335 [Pseudomonadota bacterium]